MAARIGNCYELTKDGKLRRKAPGRYTQLKQRGRTKRGKRRPIPRSKAALYGQ